jgi:hypothetical protein
MENHVKHMGLLRRMFRKHEWQFLLSQHYFTVALRNAGNTLDDVERLSILGEQIIQSSRITCENASTDPAKHGGPFKTVSVKEMETGVLSNEECVSCGGAVRRIIMAIKRKAIHPEETKQASATPNERRISKAPDCL